MDDDKDPELIESGGVGPDWWRQTASGRRTRGLL